MERTVTQNVYDSSIIATLKSGHGCTTPAEIGGLLLQNWRIQNGTSEGNNDKDWKNIAAMKDTWRNKHGVVFNRSTDDVICACLTLKEGPDVFLYASFPGMAALGEVFGLRNISQLELINSTRFSEIFLRGKCLLNVVLEGIVYEYKMEEMLVQLRYVHGEERSVFALRSRFTSVQDYISFAKTVAGGTSTESSWRKMYPCLANINDTI